MWKTGLSCLLLLLAAPIQAEENPVPPALRWAYPAAAEKTPFPKLPAETVYRVAGSALSYSGEQLNKMADPVDWLPAEHPPMPRLVAHGDHDRKIEACSGCHGSNLQGELEIPNLAGLPSAYIAEQLHEFAAGRRHSSVADREPAVMMAEIAGRLKEAEIAELAKFFSSIGKRPPFVKVIEADQVPVTTASSHGWQEVAPGGAKEPIGRRIVEIAEDFNQQWAGDPHSLVIAYAPPGAVERGKALVHQGAQPCVSCHGGNLKGVGRAPPLAGRDPHYLARALWDIKSGARGGPAVALMQKPAAAIPEDQIVDIAAYLASLSP